GECGENVESFCLRGRSSYVGFSCLFLLAPVRGGTSFLFKREKKRSKETRFKPPIFKCRRRSFQVFGTNVAPPPRINPQLNTPLKHQRRAHASPPPPQPIADIGNARAKTSGNAGGKPRGRIRPVSVARNSLLGGI